MKWSLILLTTTTVLTTSVLAQNAAGTLDGRVVDASGAAVVDARVIIENRATNVRFTIPTSAEGRFYQRYLLPGTYSVTVEKAGFQKYIESGIQLDVEQTISLTIPLKVGELSSTVEVQANTAQLSTETSTVTTTINQRAILDLPTGRNPLSLANLVPGVIPPGGGSTPWISGGRNDYNDVTIDGTSVIVPENNVSHLQVGYVPIEDSVAEVSIVTNALAPEYGRTGGGTINIATRGGTNQIHFTLFEFFKNNVLNANSVGNIRAGAPRNIVRFNQFGGSVGGPIEIPHIYHGKSKTFFFVSEQTTRQPGTSTPTFSVPTEALKQGIFTGFTNGASNGVGQPVTIYDPLTVGPNSACPASQVNCWRQPFANNVVPMNRFDPVAVKLMKYWPAANSVGTITNAALQTNNWHTIGSSTSPYDKLDIRLDHNFSDKFRMFGRASNETGLSSGFSAFGNAGSPPGNGDGPNNYYNRNVTINGVYTISPSMILNFNYGFARDVAERLPFSQGTKPSDLGLPAFLDSAVDNFEFPQISVGGNVSGFNLGQSAYTTLKNYPYSHIFRGDVTKIYGRHTLKMGGVWEKLFVNFTQLGSPDGQFGFGSNFTQQNASAGTSTTQGNGFATFLLGLPNNNGGDLQFSYSAATSSVYMGAYFQDDWRVTEKLSLNLGVRYDVDTPRTERYNRLSYFDINAASPLQGKVQASAICPNCGNLKGAMMFVGTANAAYGRRQTPTDLNNWAPRVGFAYHAFAKTVFRGAYGILYAPSMLQAAGTSGSSGTEGFTGSTALNTTLDNGSTFIASLSNPFPNGIVKPLGATNGPISGTLADIGGGIGDSFFIDYVNPVVQQWNFNVQQEVKDWIIMAGYLGSKGQHLPDGESSMTYNQLPASFLSQGSNLLANVPNPFYGVIQNPTSSYNSPNIQARFLLDAYPQYTGVNAFRKPQANSIYHSFIASAEHRFRGGFTTLVSFTGGKLLDDASQVVSYIGQAGNKQDFYCRKCEKSVSAQDVSRRLVTSGTYDLPIGRSRKYLTSMPKAADMVLGGWQMNGIMVFQTGIPIAIANGGNNSANLGAPGLRPTDNGQNPQNTGSIGDRLNNYFNQSVFSQTPNYAFGNVGRFLPNVRQPGQHNLDFSLFKNFKPVERMNLQLRGEAFNFTNSPTWSSPGNTVNNPSNFGIVTNKGGNRTIQLAMKLIF